LTEQLQRTLENTPMNAAKWEKGYRRLRARGKAGGQLAGEGRSNFTECTLTEDDGQSVGGRESDIGERVTALKGVFAQRVTFFIIIY